MKLKLFTPILMALSSIKYVINAQHQEASISPFGDVKLEDELIGNTKENLEDYLSSTFNSEKFRIIKSRACENNLDSQESPIILVGERHGDEYYPPLPGDDGGFVMFEASKDGCHLEQYKNTHCDHKISGTGITETLFKFMGEAASALLNIIRIFDKSVYTLDDFAKITGKQYHSFSEHVIGDLEKYISDKDKNHDYSDRDKKIMEKYHPKYVESKTRYQKEFENIDQMKREEIMAETINKNLEKFTKPSLVFIGDSHVRPVSSRLKKTNPKKCIVRAQLKQ